MRDKELESLRVVLRYLDREQEEFEKAFPDGGKLPLWEHCDTLQEYLDYEQDMSQIPSNPLYGGLTCDKKHMVGETCNTNAQIGRDAKRAAHYASEKEKG